MRFMKLEDPSKKKQTMVKFKNFLKSKHFQALISGSAIVLLIVLLTAAIIVARKSDDSNLKDTLPLKKGISKCTLEIVESIPVNLTYGPGAPHHRSVYSGWKTLLESAKKSIDIASSYWSLRSNDTHHKEPTAFEGEDIFQNLMKAGLQRNISIRIVQNIPSQQSPDEDTILLKKAGAADVRSLNMTKFLGAGIIHTKMWLVDGIHFYVGSANLDWRSLTQVKELGVMVYNCSMLAQDMKKIYEVYWEMSKPGAVLPKKWPKRYETSFNVLNPMPIVFNRTLNSSVYLSSSPPKFCPRGRTTDIDSILSAIDEAERFVHIAVMDYAPLILYQKPNSYWPVIDDKLREVATTKKIQVKLLVSDWPHTIKKTIPFLKSLAVLSSNSTSLHVKFFKVPCVTPAQCKIPYARVNHNKYMVTDKIAYVGTSNWSGDYFVNTAGIGFILRAKNNETTSLFREELAEIFERDWNSKYSRNIIV